MGILPWNAATNIDEKWKSTSIEMPQDEQESSDSSIGQEKTEAVNTLIWSAYFANSSRRLDQAVGDICRPTPFRRTTG